MRDLGKAGEDFFSGLCAISGMTANKAVSDRNGWDLYVEIDEENMFLDAMSLHEGQVETKIQVKTTDGKNKFVDVELSNLKKMVTTPVPAFYVLIGYEGGESPAAAYLYHVDKELIDRVLKKIASLVAVNPKVKLNKRTMRLNFTQSITPLKGSRLREMMVSMIGGKSLKYIEQKTKYLESSGFEQGAHKLSFSIQGDDQLKQFIDMSLGFKGSLDVNNVHGSALRFGIATALPFFTSESAILEITDVIPDASGSLIFKNLSNGHSLKFSTDLYRGMLNQWISSDLRKFRMSSSLFEIQVFNNGKRLKFLAHPQLIKNYDITEGLKLFKLIQMFRSSTHVRLALEFPGCSTCINLNPTSDFSDCSFVIEAIEKFLTIKKHFDFYEPVFISLGELEKAQHRLVEMGLIIAGAVSKVSLELPDKVSIDVGVEADCFHVVAVNLGGYIFAELMLLSGIVEKYDSGRHSVAVKKMESLYRTVINAEKVEIGILEKDVLSVVDSYRNVNLSINLAPFFFSELLSSEGFK